MPVKLRIGLTGGIGSGKSAVSKLFSTLHVPVIDADQIARDLVIHSSPLLQVIAGHFGAEVITADGRLDRHKLREIVFHHQEKREELESLLHPAIREVITQQLATLQSAYAIIAIPLLIEAGWGDLVDRVLVVDAPVSQQLERTLARDHASRATVEAIIASQASREQRLAAADDVIDNSSTRSALQRQVEKLHRYYLSLCREITAD